MRIEIAPMTKVEDAAVRLWGMGPGMEAEFNGILMVCGPGDTPNTILDRWYKEMARRSPEAEWDDLSTRLAAAEARVKALEEAGERLLDAQEDYVDAKKPSADAAEYLDAIITLGAAFDALRALLEDRP